MFQGAKVRLRAVEPTDLALVMQWVNDPIVTEFLPNLQLPQSSTSEQQYLQRVTTGDHPRDRFYAVETGQGEYLGVAGLHGIDWVNRRAELGLIIGRRERWGQGYGRDAVSTLLQVAFLGLNLRKVYLRTASGNQRALACYRRVGFVEVGRLHRHRFLRGEWQDEVYLEIFKEQWMGEGDGK